MWISHNFLPPKKRCNEISTSAILPTFVPSSDLPGDALVALTSAELDHPRLCRRVSRPVGEGSVKDEFSVGGC